MLFFLLFKPFCTRYCHKPSQNVIVHLAAKTSGNVLKDFHFTSYHNMLSLLCVCFIELLQCKMSSCHDFIYLPLPDEAHHGLDIPKLMSILLISCCYINCFSNSTDHLLKFSERHFALFQVPFEKVRPMPNNFFSRINKRQKTKYCTHGQQSLVEDIHRRENQKSPRGAYKKAQHSMAESYAFINAVS